MSFIRNPPLTSIPLPSRLAQGTISLAILSAPLWASPAKALNPDGLTGPFGLDRWKLVASYIDAGGATRTLPDISNPDYICNPSFAATGCVDGPSLSEESSIVTGPPGAFTLVGATSDPDFTEAVGLPFTLSWILEPDPSRTASYFVSFDFLYGTSDETTEIEGYFAINGVPTQIRTSTAGQSSFGVFRIKPTDTISFAVRSSNLDNNFGFINVTNFTADVPGPLPLLGVGAAFGWSRRLRSRLNQPKF